MFLGVLEPHLQGTLTAARSLRTHLLPQSPALSRPGGNAMRKFFLIAIFAALPATILAQQESPTKEQRDYFARQVEQFAQRLALRGNSDAWIQCDSLLPRDCLELAARSLQRRDELLIWHSYDQCASLSDFEKL